MKEITVNVAKLLTKLHENRNTHRNLFLKAQVGYRKQIIEILDAFLKAARDNKKIETFIDLIAPIDMTEEYDIAIEMLSDHVDKTIKMTNSEYKCYAMDKWSWQASVIGTNSSYVRP